MTDPSTTRRGMLATTAAAGAVALAGCSGGGDDGSGGSSAAFESVEIVGEELVVQLAADAVETVNVIGPSGEPSLGSASVTTGATQISLNLVQDYEPGEHEIVAVDGDGNEIGSTNQRLEPEVELEQIVTHDMGADSEWPPGAFIQGQALLTLTNTGNAPAQLRYITWDNVPNYSDINRETAKSQDRAVGIHDKDLDQIQTLLASETKTGATGLSIFRTSADFTCGQTQEAEITIGYQQEETIEVPVSYNSVGSSSTSDCEITVEQQP